ncbi:MAG TPA: hypothetical protein VIY47_05765, partial [Ignavibacteriaceae bacterium]
QSECDETILHLDLLFETQSLKDRDRYQKFHSEYSMLSKKINKFIQWVEEAGMNFRIKKQETCLPVRQASNRQPETILTRNSGNK